MQPLIGIIGGSGLGEALARHGGDVVEIDTPFGPPSGPIIRTEWDGVPIAILQRHGRGHHLGPSAVPFRANIFALKTLGVTHVIASGATGSLREDIHPQELVIIDQVIDRTHRRPQTFFDEYLAVHVEFAHPFCSHLRETFIEQSTALATQIHTQGVYVCIEGPQFSTLAECRMHRSWGADVVGMTCMPEARLAREAEMCYAMIAMPTDYDCWKNDGHHDATLLEEIGQNLRIVSEHATTLIQKTISALGRAPTGSCHCQSALATAIWSSRAELDRQRLRPLAPLVGHYLDLA